MAAVAKRQVDFGTKILKNPDEVVPKEEENKDVDLDVKVLKQSHEMTLDDQSVYEKELKIEKINAWATIGELKDKIAEQGGPSKEEQRIFCSMHMLPDHVQIGQCYVNWMGYGMERWPPQFTVKYVAKGVEVVVDIPGMRDTATWEGEQLTRFANMFPIFDVNPEEMTAMDVKKMVESKIRMPAHRQQLFTKVNVEGIVDYVECENDKPLSTYDVQQGTIFRLRKNCFDENGMYVFDDAYFDETGYHPRPTDSHIQGPISTKWGH